MKGNGTILLCLLMAFLLTLGFWGCAKQVQQIQQETEESDNAGILSSTGDIGLQSADGSGENYIFYYNGEEYRARYTPDNWKIYDSYRITNAEDMKIVCQALLEVYPVHGQDMVSYRTPEDMVYEWQQHNFAYQMLPEESPWRQNVRNVDFDPQDQGKSFSQLYEDRKNKAGQ